LNPGQTHEFRHTVFVNRVINNEMLSNESGSVIDVAGFTYRYLFVARGQPCIASRGLSAAEVVTEQAPKLAVIYNRRCSFSYIKDEDRNSRFVIGLPGVDTDYIGNVTSKLRAPDVRSVTASNTVGVIGVGTYLDNQV
jgi:hypothetical protein